MLGLTNYSQLGTLGLRVLDPLMSERERAQAHQIGEPKWLEKQVEVRSTFAGGREMVKLSILLTRLRFQGAGHDLLEKMSA